MASVNLHCGFGFYGQPFDVAAALCQLDADVICVQECWLPVDGYMDAVRDDPLDEAARKLGADVLRVVMAKQDNRQLAGVPPSLGPGELVIAVLSLLPIIDSEVIDLGLAPADSVPRFGQVVTLELPTGARVRVVNTHLTHRLTSPLQLHALRQRLQADDPPTGRIPTIVVGDLNMPRPLAALSVSYSATVRGKTWPATRPLVQLDHIVVDQRIKVIESQVLPTVGSDHLPIRARLRVLPTRQGGR